MGQLAGLNPKRPGDEPLQTRVKVFSDFDGLHREDEVLIPGLERLDQIWSRARERVRNLDTFEGSTIDVDQAPIPEPGKCRVISKNES